MKRRNTPQQKAVLETLRKFHSHPTADELFAEIKKEYPGIGRATVYRNLNKLCEEGCIKKIAVPEQADRFDDVCTKHYHGKCVACGKIFDIEPIKNLNPDDYVYENDDFSVTGYDLTFLGYCKDCKNKEKQ